MYKYQRKVGTTRMHRLCVVRTATKIQGKTLLHGARKKTRKPNRTGVPLHQVTTEGAMADWILWVHACRLDAGRARVWQ